MPCQPVSIGLPKLRRRCKGFGPKRLPPVRLLGSDITLLLLWWSLPLNASEESSKAHLLPPPPRAAIGGDQIEGPHPRGLWHRRRDPHWRRTPPPTRPHTARRWGCSSLRCHCYKYGALEYYQASISQPSCMLFSPYLLFSPCFPDPPKCEGGGLPQTPPGRPKFCPPPQPLCCGAAHPAGLMLFAAVVDASGGPGASTGVRGGGPQATLGLPEPEGEERRGSQWPFWL